MAHSAKPYQCAHSPAAPTLHFCPFEAAAIGLHEAIVVARLRFWLGRSKHIFGGRPWVYNTYPEWQRQFPFWSVFTVKNLFRRLEQLGVIESTQRFNTNRWNRRKWYTLNAEALAELVGIGGVAEVESAEASTMDMPDPIEGQTFTPIEGIESASIDGADFVPCKDSGRSSGEIFKRACEGEPDEEARQPALETAGPVVPSCHHGAKPEPIEATEVVNELGCGL